MNRTIVEITKDEFDELQINNDTLTSIIKNHRVELENIDTQIFVFKYGNYTLAILKYVIDDILIEE